MFYIPTYDECIEIVNKNPEMYFYERKYVIDNYFISIFGYRYASYNNFMLPLIDKPNINALELKGISYIFDDDRTVFRHNLMLHKFWELNQYDFCTYEHFKDKKIKNITTKEDGFLITFVLLPSGDIISQTKKGFDNPENLKANKYLSNPDYYKLIRYCLLNNIQPIFELVDGCFYTNYNDEKLILTKLRNNNTGEYIELKKIIKNVDLSNISIVSEYHYNLDELLSLKKYLTNIEGWIVQFDDDSIIKIKTDWWINKKNGII